VSGIADTFPDTGSFSPKSQSQKGTSLRTGIVQPHFRRVRVYLGCLGRLVGSDASPTHRRRKC